MQLFSRKRLQILSVNAAVFKKRLQVLSVNAAVFKKAAAGIFSGSFDAEMPHETPENRQKAAGECRLLSIFITLKTGGFLTELT